MKSLRRPTHKLVAPREVRRLTGLNAREALLQDDSQRLVRIDEIGAREEFVRIPAVRERRERRQEATRPARQSKAEARNAVALEREAENAPPA
jgi:hypothetical protein